MGHITLLAQVKQAQKIVGEIRESPDAEELEDFFLAIEQAASYLDWAHKALWKHAHDCIATSDDYKEEQE